MDLRAVLLGNDGVVRGSGIGSQDNAILQFASRPCITPQSSFMVQRSLLTLKMIPAMVVPVFFGFGTTTSDIEAR